MFGKSFSLKALAKKNIASEINPHSANAMAFNIFTFIEDSTFFTISVEICSYKFKRGRQFIDLFESIALREKYSRD